MSMLVPPYRLQFAKAKGPLALLPRSAPGRPGDTAAKLGRPALKRACLGESSLHFRADQSMHANRTNRRLECPA
jgi:hypothetical protein